MTFQLKIQKKIQRKIMKSMSLQKKHPNCKLLTKKAY